MDAHLRVAVVGAGFGGIGMGVALLRHGIRNIALFDKATELGGVWRDNTYPGCNCDVPAHLYSFSFAPYRDPAVRYPGRPEILAYLRDVVETFGLTPYLQLNTAIIDARYDEPGSIWRLTTSTGQRYTADHVVFAVGMLHRPKLPVIDGLDDFTGPIFHTARWDHTTDVTGRDVAVIGTGASAVQAIPRLAASARRVTVYQRTPNWVLPKPGYDFGAVTRWALKYLPGAHRAYRWAVAAAAQTVLWPVMVRGWSRRPIELLARAHLRRQVRDRTLRQALTPSHPLGAKRILLSNDYFPALTRDNVELVTTGIGSISESAIRTVDGLTRPADVVVCATGFRATEFLAPIRICGRGGRLLQEQWADGAKAYLGTAVPGFPNLFMIAGPDTFNSAGSNIAIKESQIRMILAAMRWSAESGAKAIEPSAAAMAEHQQWLRQAMDRTVWPDGGPSWYRTEQGRVVAPWPGTATEFDHAARRDPATVFEPVPARQVVACSAADVRRDTEVVSA
ncbi:MULTISPECIES: flavin-containing monooxygenase [Nocardia]|uniref:flavin-containing monooxygenase n=1 Tax=Nocardia TaxID=1817 RepID=UPI000D6928E1|nr:MULTISPECIES: NAD(P)/FAD-dependent oxidoreductase [Nocardia]